MCHNSFCPYPYARCSVKTNLYRFPCCPENWPSHKALHHESPLPGLLCSTWSSSHWGCQLTGWHGCRPWCPFRRYRRVKKHLYCWELTKMTQFASLFFFIGISRVHLVLVILYQKITWRRGISDSSEKSTVFYRIRSLFFLVIFYLLAFPAS